MMTFKKINISDMQTVNEEDKMSKSSQRSDGTDKSLKEIKETNSDKSEKDDDENSDFERAQVRTRELKHRTNKESEEMVMIGQPQIDILDSTGKFMAIDGSDDEEEKKDGMLGEGLAVQGSTPRLQNEDSWFQRPAGMSRMASSTGSHEARINAMLEEANDNL